MKLVFQLFIFFLPTQLAYHFWPDFSYVGGLRVDYLSPTVYFSELLLVMLLTVWLIRDKTAFKHIGRYKRMLFIVGVLAVFNIGFAKVPVLAAVGWVRVAEALGLWIFIRSNRHMVKLIKTPLILSLGVTLFLAFAQIINAGSLGGVFYWIGERNFTSSTPGIALTSYFGREVLRPYATFGHPNAMAGYALASLFLFKKSRLMVIVAGALIMLSFSQNAWLSLVASPVVYYFAGKIKNGYAKFVRIAAVSSFFLTLAMPGQLPREISERIELNVAAGNLIAQNPVLGVGLGNFTTQLPYIIEHKPIWLLQPVHNIFLLAASELGILGLLAFTYFISKSISKRNALAVTAIIMTGLFDHYWFSLFQNMMLAAVVLGCYNLRVRK